jgi:hypothetical protein
MCFRNIVIITESGLGCAGDCARPPPQKKPVIKKIRLIVRMFLSLIDYDHAKLIP